MFRQIQTAERRCDRCESIVSNELAGDEDNLPTGWIRLENRGGYVELCSICKSAFHNFLKNQAVYQTHKSFTFKPPEVK